MVFAYHSIEQNTNTMKHIITILLLFLSINVFGQAYGQDGFIEKVSKSKEEEKYYLKAHSTTDIKLTDITIKCGKVEEMRYFPYEELDRIFWKKTQKFTIIEYFELILGLRNLAQNNITTVVYRTRLYEYRIADSGMIIKLII